MKISLALQKVRLTKHRAGAIYEKASLA